MGRSVCWSGIFSSHLRGQFLTTLFILGAVSQPVIADTPGITNTEIKLGTVLDLEGRSSALGQNMLEGMQAALENQFIDGKKLSIYSKNDSYTPDKTIDATNELLEQGVFLFMGNVGTPTAKVALPLLAEQQVPALGFFTGSGILRPDNEQIVNYRASYRQETEAVINKALQAGVEPTEVCAYVQNDAYGMSGIEGISAALKDKPDLQHVQDALKDILSKEGDNPERNGIGPVGVYVRNTFRAREGYDSLKAWEAKLGIACRLVVTVGSYDSIAHFVAYAKSKGESWTYSAVSFTGAENLQGTLKRFGVTDHVMISQVVPALDSNLTLVEEAREALGEKLNLISLEGYIVGRLLLYGLEQLSADSKALSRENLLAVYQGEKFDLGGLLMDFSDDNQGSDFVEITKLENDAWVPMRESTWRGWYNE